MYPLSISKETSTGYWFEMQWISFIYRKVKYGLEDEMVGTALRNKNVYFLGGSTSHQWFQTLCQLMNVPYIDRDPREPFSSYVSSYNTTFHFVSHQISIHEVHPIWWYRYEVDVLDSLNDSDCNYVIELGPCFHFVQWSRDAYIERLLHTRAAVVRLLARCPNTIIVVKGPHARDIKEPAVWSIMKNNFILYEMNLIMKDVFKQPGIEFFNLWDMNLAYPSDNSIHMPIHTQVEEELSMFIQYVSKRT